MIVIDIAVDISIKALGDTKDSVNTVLRSEVVLSLHTFSVYDCIKSFITTQTRYAAL